jgi:quinol monooxygenase YgiN
MAIAVIADVGKKENYEAVNEKMFGTKRPDPTLDGLIVHSAGEGPNGFRVVDIWESQEAFDAFMNERIMPAVKEAGLEMQGSPPEIIELLHVMINEQARV